LARRVEVLAFDRLLARTRLEEGKMGLVERLDRKQAHRGMGAAQRPDATVWSKLEGRWILGLAFLVSLGFWAAIAALLSSWLS
jgi:hypothetical protein